MKVIMYMAMTPNGYIAKEDDWSEFLDSEAWAEYLETAKSAGNVVMGRRTYEIALGQGEFPFKDCLNVVMTSQKIVNEWPESVTFTNAAPAGVLKMLEKKGFKSVFLAGGGKVNSSFLKEGLVDEIYLDVVPFAFGKGVKLFAESDFEVKLKVLDVKKSADDVVMLHYKVLK